MPENRGYLPEGLSAPPLYTLEMLRRAVSDDTVLEGTVQRCDGDLNLYLQLGSTFAKIPREEVTALWISGADPVSYTHLTFRRRWDPPASR